jgi:RES domain-containing protein
VRLRFRTTIDGAPLEPESRTWYRALQTHFLATALSTRHTRTVSSRFSAAAPDSPGYEILYLAENHAVALLEAQALLGSPVTPGGIVPHPHSTWTILNVAVRLQAVADLTDMETQDRLETTAQEITGDWLGYRLRGPETTLKGPTGPAPTQELGNALFRVPALEGFRTISAKVPYQEILVVFPEKLLPGSSISWLNPLTGRSEGFGGHSKRAPLGSVAEASGRARKPPPAPGLSRRDAGAPSESKSPPLPGRVCLGGAGEGVGG